MRVPVFLVWRYKMSMLSFIAKAKNAIKAVANKAAARIAVARQSFKNASETLQTLTNRQTKPELQTTTINEVTQETPKNVSRETFEQYQKHELKEDNNETFKFLLRNAGDPFLSPYDPGDVQAFFMMTRFIWHKPEVPLADRVQAIADYFNAPLDQIFDYIIKSKQYEDYLEQVFLGEGGSPNVFFSPFEINGAQVRGTVL